MNFNHGRRVGLLLLLTLTITGCTDEFYLSEKEVVAYRSALATESAMNLNLGNLQGHAVTAQFDNSTGTPVVSSSNLLAEMRGTGLANVEGGPAQITLDRLSTELEKQMSNWISGRLQLYTGASNETARLTQLDSITAGFNNDPTFSFHSDRQTIGFDVQITLTINGTIEVTALDAFLDFFFNINGTYPLTITIHNLRLQGEADLNSGFADAGRIHFKLTPQRLGPIEVLGNGASVPSEVSNGVRDLLSQNLSARVDEVFVQRYDYFALTKMGLSQQGELQVAYRPRTNRLGPHATDPTLHVVARAADGKLYHGRRSTGGWTSYSAVPFPGSWPVSGILQDPALFHSGGNQLELAAVNQNNALVYGHWRDETWNDFNLITPGQGASPAVGYRGKPAIVASAPGQVEIVVRDGNGKLWHLRRVSGVWIAPAMVPLNGFASAPAPYRDPTALHIGNKIAVVFVNGQNRPTAIAFDLETGIWGQPASLNTQSFTNLAPAAVASGDRRCDVVYVGSGGTPYHRVLRVTSANFVSGVAQTGITISGNEIALNEVFNSSPVLVASGYEELELIGRGLGNRLYHIHYRQTVPASTFDGRPLTPGWQTWSSFIDNLDENAPTTSGQVSGYAMAATRTGRTELVTRAFGSTIYTQTGLFHNNYESERYATAPWKAVHWRGYQGTGTRLFLGNPALAAVDRNFELVFTGRVPGLTQPTPHSARMGESNAAAFTLFSAPMVRTATSPVDPIVLSVAPGTVDVIAMRTDGRPVHTRLGGGVGGMLNIPTNVTLTRMAAVGYGNGMLDLVGLGTDNKLYHWRYRNQGWSSPVLIAAGLISAPALVHVGAGQLELLAIDPDYVLKRWRFTGTSWLGPSIISASFQINHILFGPSAVSSYGDGSVDVVVVNRTTQEINHRRIGPGDEACIPNPPLPCPAPRVFANLGGRAWEDPVLTAFSSTRLHVLIMQGLRWYSTWASKHPSQWVTVPAPRDPRLLWTGFELIGGEGMVVSATAHSGSKEIAAVAIGMSGGRVFVNRIQDGRWTGFQPVVGQTTEMIWPSPVFLPAVVSHGG
jgi:hypothetical protein